MSAPATAFSRAKLVGTWTCVFFSYLPGNGDTRLGMWVYEGYSYGELVKNDVRFEESQSKWPTKHGRPEQRLKSLKLEIIFIDKSWE